MTTLKDAYIIIVEDDPNARLVSLDLLRLAGADNCYARKSVASAMQFAEKLPHVDLFLVDINMPGQSGYDLLREARDHEQLRDTAIVAVTAGTLESDVSKARELGFNGFISKPLRMGEFAKQIEGILNGEMVWDWR